MLSFDSVKLRLERQQELSFLEFNYMILQAYDYVELHKRHGCVLQMGGSDQWGNIVNGIDLGRRMLGAQLFALTSPLITTASGAKMGKTAQGAVWLDANMVSPYDYWQFWRNTEDGDVERFLKYFHRAAARRDRAAGRSQGRRNQRGEEDSRHRSDDAGSRRAAAAEAAQTARKTFDARSTSRPGR
jgi:tyrosyl-tRNA synthetase